MPADRGIRPANLHACNTFVETHHSYLTKVQGCRFCLEAFDETGTVAVIIVGRPIARVSDDGYTAEITRLCCGPTAGYATASNLIKRAVRACKAMGYRRVVSICARDAKATPFVMSNFKAVRESHRKPWHNRKSSRERTGPEFAITYEREL